MRSRVRLAVSLVASLVVLVALTALTLAVPPSPDSLVPTVLLGALIAFTTAFGVPLAGGRASLLPMTMVASYLVLGPGPTAWAAFVGTLVYGFVRYRWAKQLGERSAQSLLPVMSMAVINGLLQVASILVGGLVYGWLGGNTPLTEMLWSTVPHLVLLGLTYLGLNLLLAGLYFAARGRDSLAHYVRSLPNLMLYEGGSMVFAPLMALVYTQLGLGPFILLVLAIVIVSLVARSLSLTTRRLERRVRELDSLQAVGQALSASLDLDSILGAIYAQVAYLMPAHNSYVALYDPDADEVSFPLATEEGQPVHWRSRRAGNGLTEYILRTRAPLLIRGNYEATLEALGIARIGRLAEYWLGVPILVGGEPLGVIAVQSFSPDQEYDFFHREVLVTIAAQAAVAIQNARLYARTDEALARRVQELDSILRTTQEGILLLDCEQRVLAANRALADLLGIAQLELAGRDLHSPDPESGLSLAERVGVARDEMEAKLQRLMEAEQGFEKERVALPGPTERYVERTLVPVRDRQGGISGWLLIFRDITEEHELAQLRDDLTNMLIHDLRSPLTVLTSSLELMKADLDAGRTASLGDLIQLAEQGGNRLLRLVNDLLDINRLESGTMEVHPETVGPEYLLENVAARFAPQVAQARIEMEISADPAVPPVYADPKIMDRVIHNLVDNATKFTPDGGRIRLWARLDNGDRSDTVLIGVSDTGPGISAQAQSRLFRKFQQVVSNAGRRMGTGLGLPFCKLAVEAHGGEIWVESEVGKGSTFIVRLPVAPEDTAPAP